MPRYARVRISSHTFAMKSAVSNGCVSLGAVAHGDVALLGLLLADETII